MSSRVDILPLTANCFSTARRQLNYQENSGVKENYYHYDRYEVVQEQVRKIVRMPFEKRYH